MLRNMLGIHGVRDDGPCINNPLAEWTAVGRDTVGIAQRCRHQQGEVQVGYDNIFVHRREVSFHAVVAQASSVLAQDALPYATVGHVMVFPFFAGSEGLEPARFRGYAEVWAKIFYLVAPRTGSV